MYTREVPFRWHMTRRLGPRTYIIRTFGVELEHCGLAKSRAPGTQKLSMFGGLLPEICDMGLSRARRMWRDRARDTSCSNVRGRSTCTLGSPPLEGEMDQCKRLRSSGLGNPMSEDTRCCLNVGPNREISCFKPYCWKKCCQNTFECQIKVRPQRNLGQ